MSFLQQLPSGVGQIGCNSVNPTGLAAKSGTNQVGWLRVFTTRCPSPQYTKRLSTRRYWLWALSLIFFTGCEPQAQIETHRVPLEMSGLPVPAGESRMVVAVARRQSATWFFKFTGPVGEMKKSEAEWIAYLQSVRFNASEEPTGTVPTGWVLQPPREMRFQTYRLGNNRKVELAISNLGPDFDVLFNFNRWRGQLGLAEISEADLSTAVGELAFGEDTFLMFDEVGRLDTSGMGGPTSGARMGGGGATQGRTPGSSPPEPGRSPAGNSASANSPGGPPSSNRVPSPLPFQYRVPAGWTEVPNPPVVALQLEKAFEGQKVQIKITPLPKDLGKWSESVVSWVAESGISPPDPAVVDRTRTVDLNGVSVQRIDLLDLAGQTKGIVGLRWELQDTAWYIKLVGPSTASAAALPEFEVFLASLKWPTATASESSGQ